MVTSAAPNAAGLAKAAAHANKAIGSLRETPFSAAGVNLRYQFEALPDPLLGALQSQMDDQLADADLRVASRSLIRSVEWRDGLLNIQCDEKEDASGWVVFNFHLQSTTADKLVAWLASTNAMAELADKLLSQMTESRLEETRV
jgi:hypothetical protein